MFQIWNQQERLWPLHSIEFYVGCTGLKDATYHEIVITSFMSLFNSLRFHLSMVSSRIYINKHRINRNHTMRLSPHLFSTGWKWNYHYPMVYGLSREWATRVENPWVHLLYFWSMIQQPFIQRLIIHQLSPLFMLNKLWAQYDKLQNKNSKILWKETGLTKFLYSMIFPWAVYPPGSDRLVYADQKLLPFNGLYN